MIRVTASVLAIFLAAASGAFGQEYPTRPIRVLVPYAPGGVVDTTTRIVTNKITERLGWQIVVDNRPGGNGFIAVGIAAKGSPDGYTILSAHTGEFAISPFVFKGVPFELERDFESVVMLSDAPMLVVVNSQSPINSFKDLVAAAKAKPGQVSFGSPGTGSVNHLASEWLSVAAGIKTLHVPYKGGAPAVTAVATNEVVWTIAGLPGVTPHLQSKRVKVLGITTAKRTAQTSQWATAQESGIPSVDASIWVGFFVPKGTPKRIIDRLYTVSVEALKFADVKERFATVGGAETIGMPPTEFHQRVKQDAERYRKVVKDVGIEPQ
jgi:tripartite-type tricarboxylate transporter receptor subunit TctC